MSSMGNGIISNANIAFKIIMFQNLGDVEFKHSFTLLHKRPESEKRFFKHFFKHMTDEYGPAETRWSYSRGTLGYFTLRFRDYKDAAQFKILI